VGLLEGHKSEVNCTDFRLEQSQDSVQLSLKLSRCCPRPGPAHIRRPALGFRLVNRVETSTFPLPRFGASRPRLVTPTQVERARIDSIDAEVLLQW